MSLRTTRKRPLELQQNELDAPLWRFYASLPPLIQFNDGSRHGFKGVSRTRLNKSNLLDPNHNIERMQLRGSESQTTKDGRRRNTLVNRHYIVIDIDHPQARYAWELAGLPQPTIAVINRDNGHAQYFYELDSPVYFDRNNSNAAKEFYKDVSKGLTFSLYEYGADLNFKNYVGYCPLNREQFETITHDRTFDLSTLRQYADLTGYRQHKRNERTARAIISPKAPRALASNKKHSEGRHDQLFKRVFWDTAIPIIDTYRQKGDFSGFYQVLQTVADTINATFATPETKNEIAYQVNQIAAWSWLNAYTPKSSKKRCLNRGRDILAGIGLTVSEKQQIAARVTNEGQIKKTIKTLSRAAQELFKASKPLTKSGLARKAKMSVNTVRKYWSQLETEPPAGNHEDICANARAYDSNNLGDQNATHKEDEIEILTPCDPVEALPQNLDKPVTPLREQSEPLPPPENTPLKPIGLMDLQPVFDPYHELRRFERRPREVHRLFYDLDPEHLRSIEIGEDDFL